MNSIIYDDFQEWLYNPNPVNPVQQGGFPPVVNSGPLISPPHQLPPQPQRESMDTSEPMQVTTTGDTYMDCESTEVGQFRSICQQYLSFITPRPLTNEILGDII
jgi:hypothetical protein